MENSIQPNNQYEDIDRLISNQNELLNKSLEEQNSIIDKSTQMNIQQLEKNKTDVNKETEKTNRGIYQEYRKAQNPYGYNAEALASQGLGNSGYAETTRANLYNTYQKNITDTMNNAKNLKADFDMQISQAIQNGDITKAQNALEIYNQRMQLLAQEYELRNNREQYLYQKQQDSLSQSNWEKQFAYQQNRDIVSDQRYNQEWEYQQNRDNVSDERYNQEWEYQKQRDEIEDNRYLTEWERQKQLDDLEEAWRQKEFEYQKSRDAVSDSQWQQEYNLQKKTASNGGSSNGYYVTDTNSIDVNEGMSDNANEWYTKMLQREQATGRQSSEEELAYGLSEALKAGLLDSADIDAILKKRGY